jgi:hypothetical protein
MPSCLSIPLIHLPLRSSSQTACLACPDGSYSAVTGGINNSVCRSCENIEYAEAGAGRPGVCKPYGPGKFISVASGPIVNSNGSPRVCVGCAANQYIGDQTCQGIQCMSCPSGTSPPALTASRDGCIDWGPNSVRQANDLECHPCATNTFRDESKDARHVRMGQYHRLAPRAQESATVRSVCRRVLLQQRRALHAVSHRLHVKGGQPGMRVRSVSNGRGDQRCGLRSIRSLGIRVGSLPGMLRTCTHPKRG